MAVAVPHTLVTLYDIVSRPGATPVTTPAVLTVAMVVLALVQVPPVTASARVPVDPTHTTDAPVMVPASGSGFTVTACIAIADPHMLVTVYLIVSTPAATPVTIPVDPTVASVVLALLHAPPVVASASIIVSPAHTDDPPVMLPATGKALTVIGALMRHPVGNVYVIVSRPASTPDTTPVEEPTTAIVVRLLLHVPPEGVELSVTVAPAHTWVVPVIADGKGFTVTTAVARHPDDNA